MNDPLCFLQEKYNSCIFEGPLKLQENKQFKLVDLPEKIDFSSTLHVD